MRRLAIVPFLLLIGVSCSDPAGPNGKFCDVVKRIHVTADPMAGGPYFSDPKILADAMTVRVRGYSDLAAAAPVAIKPDAVLVSSGIGKIAAALAAAGYSSSAANQEPLATMVKDPAFLAAQLNVTRFSDTACKEKAVS